MAWRDAGVRLALAAEALVGVPFRLHGRDVATGLDCVGVVGAALAGIGRGAAVPVGYAMKMRSVDGLLGGAAACGLVPAAGPGRPGDVMLFALGPAQFHLAVADSGGGIVHAHAGLRRVVRGALPVAWDLRARWRLDEE